jgi:phage terminase large subunit
MQLEVYSNSIVQAFEPLPKQKLFMWHVFENPKARFVWYCGGFGSGKSFIGSHTAVRLAMMAPRGRGLIARQTLVDLKATTMKTFFEVIDPRLILKWNKSENLLTLINGHEIYFWGLDDIEKLKSLEIGWFWFDEVDEVGFETFKVAQGRLRHKAQPKRLGIITSNSEGKNWTYQRFVKGKDLARPSDLEKYWIVKAPSTENFHLPEDYIDTLHSYTGDLYKRYVLGSWDVFEGQIFPDFRRDIHVVRPFAIPKEWKKIRCMDWGENNPTTCNWIAVDPEGNLWVYREYSKRQEFTPYHSKAIKKLSGNEKYEWTVIDPSVKGRRGRSGKNIDEEYKKEGFKPLLMGNNNVSAGISRLHRLFYVDPDRIHPITKEKGSPRIFFFDTCGETIDCIEQYRWKKPTNDDEDPQEKPLKKDDHLIDGIRYGVMSKPDVKLGFARNKFALPSRIGKPANVDEELMKNAFRNNPGDFM